MTITIIIMIITIIIMIIDIITYQYDHLPIPDSCNRPFKASNAEVSLHHGQVEDTMQGRTWEILSENRHHFGHGVDLDVGLGVDLNDGLGDDLDVGLGVDLDDGLGDDLDDGLGVDLDDGLGDDLGDGLGDIGDHNGPFKDIV